MPHSALTPRINAVEDPAGGPLIATASVAGAVSTTTQTLAGQKTFTSFISTTTPGAGSTGGVQIRDVAGNPGTAYLQFTNNAGSAEYANLRASTGSLISSSNFEAPNVKGFVYTPTVDFHAGIDTNVSLTPQVWRWARVGPTVTLSGTITINPDVPGYTEISITLPVDGGSNNFASYDQACGVAHQWQLNTTGGILAITGQRRVVMGYTPTNTDSRIWIITATYQIV